MLKWIKERLLPEARNWYRHFSMQVALFVSFILVPLLINAGPVLLQVFNEMPPELKAWAPAWLGPLIFGFLFLARYWDQSKKDKE